jgi:hypothetical protein
MQHSRQTCHGAKPGSRKRCAARPGVIDLTPVGRRRTGPQRSLFSPCCCPPRHSSHLPGGGSRSRSGPAPRRWRRRRAAEELSPQHSGRAPRGVDDAATASSASSDCCPASRSVLRDRRRVCRELLEEVRCTITDTGELRLQRVAVHPTCGFSLQRPGRFGRAPRQMPTPVAPARSPPAWQAKWSVRCSNYAGSR